MPKVFLTKQTVRNIIRESLGEAVPLSANPIVDPSAAEIDPLNDDFVPQNKVEFNVAINHLMKDVPASDVPKTYKALQDAIDVEEEEMSKNTSDKSVEEWIRRAVRKILIEMTQKSTNEAGSKDLKTSKEKNQKTRKPVDPGPRKRDRELTLDELAEYFGLSVAGAKQLIDKGLKKLLWTALKKSEDPEGYELLLLQSMKDWIELVEKTGNLPPEDIELLRNAPDLVSIMPDFREYWKNVVRKKRKEERNEEEDEEGEER